MRWTKRATKAEKTAELGIPTGCPYQKGKNTIICEAAALMAPSIEETEKYCRGDFEKCPYYRTACSQEAQTEMHSKL